MRSPKDAQIPGRHVPGSFPQTPSLVSLQSESTAGGAQGRYTQPGILPREQPNTNNRQLLRHPRFIMKQQANILPLCPQPKDRLILKTMPPLQVAAPSPSSNLLVHFKMGKTSLRPGQGQMMTMWQAPLP